MNHNLSNYNTVKQRDHDGEAHAVRAVPIDLASAIKNYHSL